MGKSKENERGEIAAETLPQQAPSRVLEDFVKTRQSALEGVAQWKLLAKATSGSVN